MKKAKIIWIYVFCLVLLCSFFECDKGTLNKQAKPEEQSSDSQIIKLGAIMALTGDLASYGKRVKDGMDLAMDEVNASDGISGKKLEIIYEDNQGKPDQAVNAFKKLVDVDKVPLVLGPMLSSESLATAPIAEEKKVVQLSTLAGTIKLKDAGDYVFRLFASDEFQGVYLADVAINQFSSKKAAIVYVNNAYGQGIRDVIKRHYVDKGGKIVAEEAVTEGGTDFNTQVTKIKNQNPDLVFGLTYYNEGGPLLAQLKQQGVEVPVLGGDAWFGPMAQTAGSAESMLVFSSIAFGPEYKNVEKMQEFIEHFKSRYGSVPDSYSATGYDAVYAAKLSIEKAGLSPEKIKEALYKVEFHGALGHVVFNENGDNSGVEFSLFKMVDDQAIPYKSTE